MTSLHIRLLGDFVIENDGDPPVAVDSVRLQSVLAYLLLHHRARQSRQQVAFQLWPDSSEEQARSNLRKALHYLRRALPDVDRFLYVDARTVQWRADSLYTLDVHEFENELERAAGVVDDSAAQAAALSAAVALYRGDLLPSCYDEWVIPERERLRQRFIAALERLMGLAEERRDYAAAIEHANHLLRYDPLHEPAYHHLMRCHAHRGDRAGALRVYHTCVALLQRELGVEPGHEVQAAHVRLLERETPTSLRAEPAFPSPASERLVGRQQEWQTLRTAWQNVLPGRVHFCLVRGEAGIGKTRLTEELLAWTDRQGIATARTRSYAAAGGLAYTPVIEWLRSPALQTALTELDDVWLTEIARLLPELLVEQPALRRPEPLADRWQRQRLFEALARAFLTAPSGPPQPKLLVIDDLQWCDADTLEWLRYLLHFAGREAERGRPLTPLFIVGTARAEEVDRDHPLNALLLDLRSTGQMTELALGPLSATESTDLAAQLTKTALDEAASVQLYTQTEGNPLFIVETLRARIGDRRPETRDLSHNLQSPVSSLPSLPPRVQAVIQYRLAQLSPAARALTDLAAAIGRSFTFELLNAASDATESEFVRNLDELWQRGIIRAQGSQAYDFSHDRIREVAYAAISPVQRPLLHRRVAGALERVYADDLDPVSAQLAAHYEQAGDLAQAVEYYRRAAEVAEARYDHTKVIEFINMGLWLLQTQPGTPESTHRELSMLLAKANSLAVVEGFTDREMAKVCAEIEKLLPQVGNDKLIFRACQRLSGFFCISGKMEMGARYGEHLLELAYQINEPSYLLSAYQACGVLNLQLGCFALGRQYMEQGDALCRELVATKGERALIDNGGASIVANLAFTLWLLGYPERASAKMAEAMLLAARASDPYVNMVVTFFVTLVARYQYELEQTAEAAARLFALDAQYGIPLNRASGRVAQGWVWAQEGRLVEGIGQMRAGIDQMIAMNHTMFQTHRLAWLAEAQMRAGLWEDAAATLDGGFVMSDHSGQRSGDAELHRLRGEWLVQHGQFAEAEAAFEQAIEIARTQEAKSFELRAVMSLYRLGRGQGRRDEARTRLAEIYGWFTEGFDTADLQEAQALLVELA